MGDVRTEPSMEEILASIKRIIADDGAALNGARIRPRTDSAEPPPEAVLELTEAVAPPALTLVPPAVPAPPAPPASEPVAAAAPIPIAAAPIATAPVVAPPPVAPPAPAATLVSDDTACASRQSLSALSSMVLRTPESDNTLDGLVRELLRPMLKEWLDARLPDLVETLVAREIARITGKSV